MPASPRKEQVQGVPGVEHLPLGSSICPHKREKSTCKECGGSQICEHNRRRSECKECLGSSICPHKRIKYRCKDCRRSAPY
jgi:hypothetical protein